MRSVNQVTNNAKNTFATNILILENPSAAFALRRLVALIIRPNCLSERRRFALDSGTRQVHFLIFWTIGTTGMPLTRGEALRFDLDRTAFEFTMLDGGGAKVRCQISGAAMDELAGTRGTPSAEREAQFARLRDVIEHLASDKFDRGILKGAVVRLFVKDVPASAAGPNSTDGGPGRLAPDEDASSSSG